MKLNRLFLIAAAGLVACAEPEGGLNVKFDGERAVELSIVLPEFNTRAEGEVVTSAHSGLKSIDWAKYDLRYQIEIRDAEGKMACDRIVKTQTTGGNFTESVTLTAGRDYKVYAWADFVAEKDGENPQTDLHYNTTDFAAITYNGGVKINDESCDAYCGVGEITDTKRNLELTLTRPMGKLRVVTVDADKLSFGQYPDNVVFTSTTALPAGYNLFTGELLTETVKPENVAAPILLYGNEIETGAERTLLTSYLFGGESTTIQFALTSKDADVEIYTMNVVNDIPVQPNKLTTLKGSTLTNTADITCTVTDTLLTETEYEQDGNGNWVEKQ